MVYSIKRCACALIASQAIISGFAADNADNEFSYMPNIHGVIRSRYEHSFEDGEGRFEVRNARLTLDGKVAPSIDYFVQVDLCDQGKMKPLDFWARLEITKGLKFQAGQFRMPFGIDPFRAPANYIFSNRSFIGRQICNYRAVGFKLSYTLPKIPLMLEGGVFNPNTIAEHNVWNKKMAYAAKALYTWDNVKLSTGIMSICPDQVRANIIDGAISWSNSRWLVEGEYMHEHYTNSAHKPCNGYNLFADYHFPINAGVFNRLTFQGRFDAMTDHSTGQRDSDGFLQTNNCERKRITLGSTISYIRTKSMFVDIRVNYEKYFYDDNVTIAQGEGDKAVVELVLRF